MGKYCQYFYENGEEILALMLFHDIQKNFGKFGLKQREAFDKSFYILQKVYEHCSGLKSEDAIAASKEAQRTIPETMRFMAQWIDKNGKLHTEVEPFRLLTCALCGFRDKFDQAHMKKYISWVLIGLFATDEKVKNGCLNIITERNNKAKIRIMSAGYI